MDEYQTVFFFADSANRLLQHDYGELITPTIFAIGGLAVFLFFFIRAGSFKELRQTAGGKEKLIGGAALSAVVGCCAISQILFDIQEGMYENLELLDIYNKNEYQITEGQVHVLYVSHGHDGGDSIIINGVNFRVGLNTTVGYKTLIAEGGVLREGMDVRVFHYNGKILRVDTKIPNTNSLWNPSLPKAVVG